MSRQEPQKGNNVGCWTFVAVVALMVLAFVLVSVWTLVRNASYFPGIINEAAATLAPGGSVEQYTQPRVESPVTPAPDLEPGFAEATNEAYFATREAEANPTQPPENVIVWGTAAPARAHDITDEQLAACLQAQQTGRRLAPYCPPNPAEYAGQGR